MKKLKQELIRLCFFGEKKKDRSKLKNTSHTVPLCFQAFYCATDKIVQISATEMYVTMPFLSSLSKLLRAYIVKYFSNPEKTIQDYAGVENKPNLFAVMEFKATHRFPESLLPSTFINIVKKNA